MDYCKWDAAFERNDALRLKDINSRYGYIENTLYNNGIKESNI